MPDDNLGNMLIIRCISSHVLCMKCKSVILAGDKMTLCIGRTSEPDVHFTGFMCANCWKIEDVLECRRGTSGNRKN